LGQRSLLVRCLYSRGRRRGKPAVRRYNRSGRWTRAEWRGGQGD